MVAKRSLNTHILAALLTGGLSCAFSAAAARDVPRISFSINEFVIEGDNPISADQAQAVLQPYLGEQEGLNGIEAAGEALETKLAEEGYGFHRVIVPPQRARGGKFKLKVLAFEIGDIEIIGNKHFDNENILRSLPEIVAEQVPNSRRMARQLAAANEHSAKRVAVFMKEADEDGKLNARIQVRDRKPWQIYSTLSNTGSDGTGRDRVTFGAQHANLFNRDHSLTLSYTTSPGFYNDVQQWGAFYKIPIYDLGVSITGYYTTSDVSQGRIASFDVSGSGEFYGLSAEYTLLPIEKYSQKLRLSFDDKQFGNDTRFDNMPIGADVRSRPLALRYIGSWEQLWGRVGFYTEVATNLATGEKNSTFEYNQNNGNRTSNLSDASWTAWRLGGDASYTFNNQWRLAAKAAAQYSGDLLISGEQFGVGGSRNVRGFNERETAGDKGYWVSTELWAPAFENNLQLMGFADHGYRHLSAAATSVAGGASETLASIGLGARWNWDSYFSASVDWAHVIDGAQATPAGHDQLHVSLLLRY